ncbi:MAG TPA: hypothetical protein VK020_08965 [Microlunatus sp.]|nr:hypothetical protein [Microlunatus sp.]
MIEGEAARMTAAATNLYELREEALRAAERARAEGRDDAARQWQAMADAARDVILDEARTSADVGRGRPGVVSA